MQPEDLPTLLRATVKLEAKYRLRGESKSGLMSPLSKQRTIGLSLFSPITTLPEVDHDSIRNL